MGRCLTKMLLIKTQIYEMIETGTLYPDRCDSKMLSDGAVFAMEPGKFPLVSNFAAGM